jgi:eukaryotic-like serine/threonine-protein kinase
MKNKQSERNWIKTALLALLVLGIYLFLSMVFTGWYTRHGQSIQVPKISGMPLENAEALLDDQDLELVIIDSVYNEDMKPNTVVEQDPLSGLNVKPGRKIYVTVNTGIKPKVKMPRLVNGSSNLALVLLQNAGLKLGRVDSVKSTFGPGLVIRQKFKGKDIAPNTALEKGAVIDIVVSKKISLSDTSALSNMNNGVSEPPAEGL